ncbi:MAG: hypothetical protein QXO69_03510 [archaeon]
MGRINFVIPDELEKQFKEEVFRKYGMKKGNISTALQEAVKQWLKKH